MVGVFALLRDLLGVLVLAVAIGATTYVKFRVLPFMIRI
jgi:hypothetical protein